MKKANKKPPIFHTNIQQISINVEQTYHREK